MTTFAVERLDKLNYDGGIYSMDWSIHSTAEN